MGRKKKINEQELLLLVGMNLTHAEIAKKLNVSRGAVTRTINELKKDNPDLFVQLSTEEYRNTEPDILAEIRRLATAQILDQLRRGERVSINQLMTVTAIALDKERLITDKSTSNVLHAHVIEGMSDKEKKLLKEDAESDALALLEIAKEEREDVPNVYDE